jgi:hypothetical protein
MKGTIFILRVPHECSGCFQNRLDFPITEVTLEYMDVGRLSFLWQKFVNKIFSSLPLEIRLFGEETVCFLSADGRRLGYFSLSYIVIRDTPVLLTPLVHLNP